MEPVALRPNTELSLAEPKSGVRFLTWESNLAGSDRLFLLTVYSRFQRSRFQCTTAMLEPKRDLVLLHGCAVGLLPKGVLGTSFDQLPAFIVNAYPCVDACLGGSRQGLIC